MQMTKVRLEHIDRTETIGGSDVAAILGMNKWKSREELLKEKLGFSETEDNNAMYWGRMAEPMIAEHIALNLEEGTYLFRPGGVSQVRHPTIPCLSASPDGFICDKETHKIIEGIEIKTAFEWTLKQWKLGVPINYCLQVQTYMMVFSLKEWRVCALIGNRTYLEHVVEADYFLHDEIAEAVVEFNVELNQLKEQTEGVLENYEKLLEEKNENATRPMGEA